MHRGLFVWKIKIKYKKCVVNIMTSRKMFNRRVKSGVKRSRVCALRARLCVRVVLLWAGKEPLPYSVPRRPSSPTPAEIGSPVRVVVPIQCSISACL